MSFYVYRYIDVNDEQTKYIGIVYGKTRTLDQRIKEHMNDEWFNTAVWRIEYFTDNLNTRCDCETWEGHLIATYETYKWYNKAKKRWGKCSFINLMPNWKVWRADVVNNELGSISHRICEYLTDNGTTQGSLYDIYDEMKLLTPCEINDEENVYKRIDEINAISKVIDTMNQLNVISIKCAYEVTDFEASAELEDGTFISPIYMTEDSNALYLLARGDVGVKTVTTLSLTALAKKFLKNT